MELLLTAVTHIGAAAKNIGDELNDHNTLLEEMDLNATHAMASMGRLNKGVAKILSSDSNASLYIIIALTLMLVVLIALVIFL